jgi:MoxR-like ATPase
MSISSPASTVQPPRLHVPRVPPPELEPRPIIPWVEALRAEMARVLVGQTELVDGLLVALLANGHVLLEGVPGLAKTLALKTLARAVHAGFARLQFTPDMLPADVVGTLVYNPREGSFETKRGPVFANFVLADEINRAPAKVQSALLEAMQEHQVTLGDETHALPDPFLVMATQNPVEQEGTYPLPEAQLDRFMFKLLVDYPSLADERRILDSMARTAPRLAVDAVVSLADIARSRAEVDEIYIDERIKGYILALVDATRHPQRHGLALAPLLRYGASPRATIALALAAKARAYLQGRSYVVPQDVKALATSVLRHRVATTYEAEAQRIGVEAILGTILEQVAIP